MTPPPQDAANEDPALSGEPARRAADAFSEPPEGARLGDDIDPTPAVHYLRLSRILMDLADDALPLASPVAAESGSHPAGHDGATAMRSAADAPGALPARGPLRTRFVERLRRRRRRRRHVRSNITIGEICDRTSHAGFGVMFGFMAALLALIAVPFVGLSVPFGLAVGSIGVQMIVGMQQPWLPQRVRQYTVSMKTLHWLSTRVARWTSGLERYIRPRMTVLARGPFWTLAGVGIVLQGVGLALPIPIPGTNWPFIIVILIYAIGLLEDDGIMILLGHALTSVGIALALKSWHLIVAGVWSSYHWLARWWT